jgi:outer membrane receptor protein involved in Fe transport
VNTAVFSNDYRDLQVQSFLRTGVIDVSSAGSATIRGIEVEAAAAAGRGVQLAGHFSWLAHSAGEQARTFPARSSGERQRSWPLIAKPDAPAGHLAQSISCTWTEALHRGAMARRPGTCARQVSQPGTRPSLVVLQD